MSTLFSVRIGKRASQIQHILCYVFASLPVFYSGLHDAPSIDALIGEPTAAAALVTCPLVALSGTVVISEKSDDYDVGGGVLGATTERC